MLLKMMACYLIPYVFITNATFKTEPLCRCIIECLTGVSFSSVRPTWLRNPLTGRSLELDGYNEELAIAFEYQGRQHYERVSRFQDTDEKFKMQVFRDEVKKSLCDEHGISLIIIPYTVQREHLPSYIHRKLLMIKEIRAKYRRKL